MLSSWGRRSWGYCGSLVFCRSWVWIPAPDSGWIFFTLICCKNDNICLKINKNKRKRGRGWPIKNVRLPFHIRLLNMFCFWHNLPYWSMYLRWSLKYACFKLMDFKDLFDIQVDTFCHRLRVKCVPHRHLDNNRPLILPHMQCHF